VFFMRRNWTWEGRRKDAGAGDVAGRPSAIAAPGRTDDPSRGAADRPRPAPPGSRPARPAVCSRLIGGGVQLLGNAADGTPRAAESGGGKKGARRGRRDLVRFFAAPLFASDSNGQQNGCHGRPFPPAVRVRQGNEKAASALTTPAAVCPGVFVRATQAYGPVRRGASKKGVGKGRSGERCGSCGRTPAP
jgi:hypothetical protein